MKILLTGATGWIGQGLIARLSSEGHDLVVLSRSAEKTRRVLGSSCRVIEWSVGQRLDLAAENSTDVDAVIHLAGESLANGRWSAKQKKEIYNSRVLGTRALFEALRPLAGQPLRIICASAIGYYGPHGDEELDETSSSGQGFLADVCRDWEAEAVATHLPLASVSRIRIGIVLGRGSGALPQLLTLFRKGLGGPVGSGRQWMSWIHYEDLISLFIFALSSEHTPDILNGTSPHPVTNTEFSQTLARLLGKSMSLKAPAFLLRLALGEKACLALDGQRVLPRATLRAGFKFRFPELNRALSEILETAPK